MKRHYLLVLIPALIPVLELWLEESELSMAMQKPPKFLSEPRLINEQSKQHILTRNLWDKNRGRIIEQSGRHTNDNANTASTAAAVTWQLKGVKMPNIAIIQVGTTLKIYHPGQTLPNGDLLKKVFIDGITVEQEQKTKHVYLFGKHR